MLGLLFTIAIAIDSPAQTLPPPPPPPPVVLTVAAPAPAPVATKTPPPEGGKLTDGEVPCDQVMADGTVYCGEGGGAPRPNPNMSRPGMQTEADAVTVTEHGYAVRTGPAELAPKDPAYLARLDAQLCAIKPWYC